MKKVFVLMSGADETTIISAFSKKKDAEAFMEKLEDKNDFYAGELYYCRSKNRCT